MGKWPSLQTGAWEAGMRGLGSVLHLGHPVFIAEAAGAVSGFPSALTAGFGRFVLIFEGKSFLRASLPLIPRGLEQAEGQFNLFNAHFFPRCTFEQP